jgi:hypothetical protein
LGETKETLTQSCTLGNCVEGSDYIYGDNIQCDTKSLGKDPIPYEPSVSTLFTTDNKLYSIIVHFGDVPDTEKQKFIKALKAKYVATAPSNIKVEISPRPYLRLIATDKVLAKELLKIKNQKAQEAINGLK